MDGLFTEAGRAVTGLRRSLAQARRPGPLQIASRLASDSLMAATQRLASGAAASGSSLADNEDEQTTTSLRLSVVKVCQRRSVRAGFAAGRDESTELGRATNATLAIVKKTASSIHVPNKCPALLSSVLTLGALLLLVQCAQLQAGAIKLPAFLSSWMGPSGATHPSPGAQLVGTSLTTAAPLPLVINARWSSMAPLATSHFGPPHEQQQARTLKGSSSPARRLPLQLVGKHTGSALLGSLPRTLFGRILSASSAPAASSNQMRHFKPLLVAQPALPASPTQWQIAQQIQQQFASMEAAAVAAAASQYNNQRQQQQRARPLSSVRPETAEAFALNASAPLDERESKKHALGYGDNGEQDFIIVNAQQVAELQQMPAGSHGDEYREVPAIVIADPEMEPVQQHFQPGFVIQSQLAQATNATTSTNSSDATSAEAAASAQQRQQLIDSVRLSANASTLLASNDTAAVKQQEDLGAGQLAGRPAQAKDAPDQAVRINLSALNNGEQQQQQRAKQGATGEPALEILEGPTVQQGVARGLESAASTAAAVIVSGHEQPVAVEQSLESFVLSPFKSLDELGVQQHQHHYQPRPPQQGLEFLSGPAESFPATMQSNKQPAFMMPPMQQQQQQQQHVSAQRPQFASLLQQARNLLHSSPITAAFNAHFSGPGPHPYQHHNQQYFGLPSGPMLEMSSHQLPAHFAAGGEFGGAAQHFQPVQQQQQRPGAGQGVRAAQAAHDEQLARLAAQTWLIQRPRQADQHQAQSNGYSQLQPQFMFAQQSQHHAPTVKHQHQLQQHQAPQNMERATGFSMVVNHGTAPLTHFKQEQQMAMSASAQNNQGKFKSGLYQIEPPKLELAAGLANTLQQIDDGESDDDEQQKIDGQETSEPGSSDLAQQQDDNEENDTEQQTQIATAPGGAQAELQQQQQQQQQTRQLAASIGVSSANVSSPPPLESANNQSTAFGADGEPMKRGQVFSEPVSSAHNHIQSSLGMKSLAERPVHQAEPTFYDFFQHEQHQNQQPNRAPQMMSTPQSNYLDTQVYTLPYTITMHSGGLTHMAPPHLATSRRFNTHAMRPQQSTFGNYFGPSQVEPQRAQPQRQEWPPMQLDYRPPQLTAFQLPAQSQADWTLANLPTLPQFNQVGPQQQQQQFFHYQASMAPGLTATSFEQPQQKQHTMQQDNGRVPMTNSIEQQLRSSEPSGEANSLIEGQQRVASSSSTMASAQLAGDNVRTSSAAADLVSTSTEPASVIVVDSGSSAEDDERSAEHRQQQQLRQSQSPSSFCTGRPAGLYADVEQRCRAYYQCAPTGHQMFRCNNQTQFNQRTQNCDWWYNVDCGGRLGSPSDFEQQLAAATTATTTTTTTATSSAPSSSATLASDTAHQSLITEPSQPMVNFVEASPSSSTVSYSRASTMTTTPGNSSSFSDRSTASETQHASTTMSAAPVTTTSTSQLGSDATASLAPPSTATTTTAPTATGEPRVGAQGGDELRPQNSSEASNSLVGDLGDDEQAAPTSTIRSSGEQAAEMARSVFVDNNKARLIKSEFGSGTQQQRAGIAGGVKAARAVANGLARLSLRQGGADLARGPLEIDPTAASTTQQTNQHQIYLTSANYQGSISYTPPAMTTASGKLERRYGARLATALTTTTVKPSN